MKAGKVRIPIGTLADDVYQYGKYLRSHFEPSNLRDSEDETPGAEMRLQVRGDWWCTHHGDPQFDQDHRGAWGSAFVPMYCTRTESRQIARDLIQEADEHAASLSP